MFCDRILVVDSVYTKTVEVNKVPYLSEMHWWPVLLLCVSECQFIAGNCWNGTKHPSISKFIRNTENFYPMEPEIILKGQLLQIGDFDNCLYEQEEQYCMTNIYLGPAKKSSEFWKRIEKITNTNARFQRDLLRVGVCVPRQCKSSDVRNGFKSALTEAASKLGITVNVTIEQNACQTKDRPPVHKADYIIIYVIVAVLVLVVSGSLYDVIRERQNPVGPVQTIGGQLLMCFSIQNNWKRLGTVQLSEDTRDFTHIQGIRTFSMCFIVMGHALFVQINMGLRNPEWLEKSYSDFFRTSFFNGTLLMATFLCISGFLLGSLFFIEIERYGFYKWPGLIIAIVYRYVRLTPVYAVIILFVAGWMNHMSKGPMHYSVVESEVHACRKNWWLNILYINNYVGLEDQCLIHGWYLAADYQCYIVSFIVLVIVCKYPNYARTILTLALIVFACIPAVQTYLERLNPTFLSYPEAIRNLTKDKTFQRSHITFHNNLTAYFVGVIYGYAYYYVKRNAVKIPKLLEFVLYICALLLPWSFLMLGFIFYQPNYKYDVYTATLYACIHRGLFSCGIGAIIFGLSLGYARPIYILLSWKPFQILGRLTYVTYLVHPYLQRIVIGGQKYPLYISEEWIALSGFSYIVVSNFVALILCLAIEMPSSALPKIIFNPERAKQYLPSRKCKHVNDAEMNGNLRSSEGEKQNVFTLAAENHVIGTHL